MWCARVLLRVKQRRNVALPADPDTHTYADRSPLMQVGRGRYRHLFTDGAVYSGAPRGRGHAPPGAPVMQQAMHPGQRSGGGRPPRILSRYKTKLCSFFMDSGGTFCPHGESCQFAHGYADLRMPTSAGPPVARNGGGAPMGAGMGMGGGGGPPSMPFGQAAGQGPRGYPYSMPNPHIPQPRAFASEYGSGTGGSGGGYYDSGPASSFAPSAHTHAGSMSTASSVSTAHLGGGGSPMGSGSVASALSMFSTGSGAQYGHSGPAPPSTLEPPFASSGTNFGPSDLGTTFSSMTLASLDALIMPDGAQERGSRGGQ